MTVPLSLIADIGGTNARFAIADDRQNITNPLTLKCADFPGIVDAARAYLDSHPPSAPPANGAFAVAGPVTGDRVKMTNHPWSFSVSEVKTALGLKHLAMVNDFIAVAAAIPHLKAADLTQVGIGTAVPDTPIAVLGAGTGLGVAALIPTGTGFVPVATEGGHAAMAASDDTEADVIHSIRADHGHASIERFLSGPGLVNIYRALAARAGRQPDDLSPAQVTAGAVERADPDCTGALDMFFNMLGSVCGDLALTYGARGGVYIAGGIVPRLLPQIEASGFRQRFTDKGRFADYLAAIPTTVITHPQPAFVGLAALAVED